tara:strand:+ start:7388 stop:7576 length:189 start_codon:yes stop_codon:yes gene_type:complete
VPGVDGDALAVFDLVAYQHGGPVAFWARLMVGNVLRDNAALKFLSAHGRVSSVVFTTHLHAP